MRVVHLLLVAPAWGARVSVSASHAELKEANFHHSVNALPRFTKTYLESGWKADDTDTEPNFLKQKWPRLFALDDEDLVEVAPATFSRETIVEDTLTASSRELGVEFGLGVEVGPFSASMESALTNGNSHNHRQMLAIYRSRFVEASVMVSLSSTYHMAKIHSSALDIISRNSAPEAIIDQLGEFYATQISMGGMVRTQFQQTQMNSSETRGFSTNIEASVADNSVSLGVSQAESATQSSQQLHVKTQLAGGDQSAFVNGGTDWDAKHAAWSRTVRGNPVPVAFTLRPIWEPVMSVDFAKGGRVMMMLQERWRLADEALQRLDNLPFAPRPPPWRGSLILHQGDPGRNVGSYNCRSLTVDACQEMSLNQACRTVDDFRCGNGQKPFKWGGDAYFGGFTLPPGLCVTTFKNWGRCTNLQHSRFCCPKDSTGTCWRNVWNSGDRTCSFRFDLEMGLSCQSGSLLELSETNVTYPAA